MTPKEKAEELVDKFNKPDITHYPYVHNAQQCALVAVDEILSVIWINLDDEVDYWAEVKKEIEAL